MVAHESIDTRDMCAILSRQNPETTVREYKRLAELKLPGHHHVELKDIRPENLKKILLKTYDSGPPDFAGLLGMQGVGSGTIPSGLGIP